MTQIRLDLKRYHEHADWFFFFSELPGSETLTLNHRLLEDKSYSALYGECFTTAACLKYKVHFKK